jgi:hypothetical protein
MTICSPERAFGVSKMTDPRWNSQMGNLIWLAGACPHLITPNEAISRIRSLLAKEDAEVRQRLVAIAGVAIAAVIALDENAAEIEEIDGLQESVNRALFI